MAPKKTSASPAGTPSAGSKKHSDGRLNSAIRPGGASSASRNASANGCGRGPGTLPGGAPGIPSKVAMVKAWDPDVKAPAPAGTELCRPVDEVDNLVVALRSQGAAANRAVADLCLALRSGGHPAADLAIEHGGVEAALALLSGGGGDKTATICHATEVLWYLTDDYDSCQFLINARGHDAVLSLARSDDAAGDASVARGAFRLLAQTLYCEARNAKMWTEADVGFVIQALGWALRADLLEKEGEMGGSLIGLVCDVAALWIQRCTGPSAEGARLLVGVVPLLLERMAARSDDVIFMQHGCRLLFALAKNCQHWPADMREPAMAAFTSLAKGGLAVTCMSDPEVMAYAGLAFKALAASPSLEAMD